MGIPVLILALVLIVVLIGMVFDKLSWEKGILIILIVLILYLLFVKVA